MTIAWSYGGGIQSVAIAVLVKEGALPKPDLAVIADTGREVQTTWDYLRDVVQPYLDPVGVKIAIAPHSMSREDLYDKSGLTFMPAWTVEGRLSAFYSGRWKQDVIERWLRSKGVKTCVQWIGFSLDEMHRATWKAHRPWCVPEYPLIDMRLSREGCKRIIAAAGLPPAHKSRCWQCPHQNQQEWRDVRSRPDEWEKAVALDEEMRELDPEASGLFLHSSRVPLAMADLGSEEDESPPLFRGCQDAGCYT